MTLSTKGKIIGEAFIDNGAGSSHKEEIMYVVNQLLGMTDTDLFFESVKGRYSQDILRLVSLRDMRLSDIMEDPEIKFIVLNPAPKTPECKGFLEGSTLMGKKEDFVDYDLTTYKAFEIAYGKIHFKRKDDAIK